MLQETKIKKYSVIYGLLYDLNEFELSNIIENKLNKQGYYIKVVNNKYKFKYKKEVD